MNYARKLTGANDKKVYDIFLKIEGENIPNNNTKVGEQDLIKELCIIEINVKAHGGFLA